MKKRAFLIHGWEGYPEEGWRPWLKNELKSSGFEVFIPAMPDTDNPKMDEWINHLTKIVERPTPNDFFVGHSLGCITILRYLETLKENEKIGGAVLVAGFGHDLDYSGYNGELSSFFKTPVSWEKIKKHCRQFVTIMSDDDPYVPLEHGDIFKEKLGAKLVVEHHMKHFSGDDGIDVLPSAKEAVLLISKS